MFLVAYYPAVLALRLGQDSAFVLAALLLSRRFHRRGRDWMAVLALTLAFEKFHLLFLIPVALWLHGKRSLVWKLGICLATVTTASALLVGRSGWSDYAALLRSDLMDTPFLEAWSLRAMLGRLAAAPPARCRMFGPR